MFKRIIKRIDHDLRSQRTHSDAQEDPNAIDAIQLEPRILYSAVPMVDVADATVDVEADEGEATVGDDSDGAQSQGDESHGDFEPINFDAYSSSAHLQHEIVFVDAGVENSDQLLSDLWDNDDPNRRIEVILLSADRDGVEQITDYLAGKSDVDAIHILSHGSEGEVHLGNAILSNETLDGYAGQLAQWAGSLETDADILFYGCDLAGGDGQSFVDAVAALCDCDVAASDDVTGHQELGGDWILEYAVGDVTTDVAFSYTTQASWRGTLDITSNLVGHYEFEENGGSTLTDSTGNADGAMNNGATWTTDEAVGTYALDFSSDSGSPSFVSVSDNAVQDFGSGDFTVSLWYNQAGNPASISRLVGDYGGSANGFVLYAQSSGSLDFELYDGTFFSSSITGIFDGTWNQLTVVRSGDTLQMFHNGVNVSTESGAAGNINSSNDLWIGASGGFGGDFDGKLDDVRLYTRALSSTDVDELVALGPAVTPPAGPPSGYSDPSGSDNSLDYITNVNFAGIDNTSGQDTNGYGNYESEVANVTLGDNNTLSVTMVEDDNNSITAWVDWNQDGDFADAGEEYVIVSGASTGGPHTVNIATPGTATLGTTIMRVGMVWNGTPTPDGGASYGEWEDYSVNVSAAATTYTVTNTNDAGAGSLRQAIIDANANAGADTIEFDIAGSGTQVISLSSALDTITEQVTINGTTQTGWVEGSFLPIVIDGGNVATALTLGGTADGSEIRGLVVRDAVQGLHITAGSDNHLIAGNWFGQFNSDGSDAGIGEAITSIAVYSDDADNVTFGGTTAADRNVVVTEGSSSEGLYLYLSDGWNIAGNYFGTDTTGNAVLASTTNAGTGFLTTNDANSNTIGGATDAHRNIFSGLRDGIEFQDFASAANYVYNNWIGLGADGTTLIGNEFSGVTIFDTHDVVVGGAGSLGNVIVGSGFAGIYTADNNNVVIQGNYIGQNEDGTIVAGNSGFGIYVDSSTNNTTIGGIAAGEGNVITASGLDGVRVFGSAAAASIRGNSIFDNDGLGIDINADGVSANDAGDSDSGANGIQNWAVLTNTTIADDGTFNYTVNTTGLASGSYTLDFYASTDRDGGNVEGQRYLFSRNVSDGAVFNLIENGVTLAVGEYVTLVTTDASGNSSEFSHYAVTTDGDSGGSVPSDLLTTATSGGGLSINNDGGNDVYLVADDGSAILGGLTELSMEVQFSSTDLNSLTPLVSYASPSQANEVLFWVTETGEIQLWIDGSVRGTTSVPQATLKDGTVQTLAFNWENTDGDWAIYHNGAEVGSGTGFKGGGSTTIDSGGTLLLGQDQDTVEGGYETGQVFKGTLHDVRVFSTLRSANELEASYDSDLPFNENGMVANWKFNELSADGVVTDTVSGNNLTLKHTSETGFTASEASLTFSLDENSIDGTVVGQVSGVDAEREAQIASLLAADPDLRYSAETGKFYKAFDTSVQRSTAQSNAASEALNSINGQLVTIRSVEEQQIVHDLAQSINSNVWLGATDATVEGEWRWLSGNDEADQFWEGDENGYNPSGSYHNFQTGKPDSGGGNEDNVSLNQSTGLWDDQSDGVFADYIVEWDADAVLDATDALTYSIASQTVVGAFEIDADTGEIRVADGLLLDADTQANHIVTVRVSDSEATPNTYDEAFTISLIDLVENNDGPTDLSSGIELNTDGGNDAYLAADNANFLLGADGHTYEVRFSGLTEIDSMATFYSQRDPGFAQSYLAIHADGTLDWAGITSTDTYSNLLDGGVHSLAITWDASTGSISFYVDGEYAESKSVSSQAGSTGGPTFVLGQHVDFSTGNFDSSEAFKGTFHDFRVWDTARSAEEIETHYQHKLDLSPTDAANAGLMANWQFDGFNGSNEVVDLATAGTGSENNLTVAHATGTGFTASTPTEDLTVSEHAGDGTRVGFVVPSQPVVADDIVVDGLFTESGITTYTEFTNGQTFGGWTVTSASVGLETGFEVSPLGGYAIDLDGSAPGSISQSLTTVEGRQYQVTFAMSGNYFQNDPFTQLRASAGGEIQDFTHEPPPNWGSANLGWEQRSFSFTAEDTSTLLQFASLSESGGSGAVIGDIQVIEIPQAASTILNDDPTLSYDAATGKFYRHVQTLTSWTDAANTEAPAAEINGVSGQLVSIGSAYENELIRDMALSTNRSVYIGGNDVTVEGEWRWKDGAGDAEQFATGSTGATALTGNYTNFGGIDGGDGLFLDTNGLWHDAPTGEVRDYVIEWDASDVLSSFTFSLTDASNNFEIDSNTGEITVAATNTLDYEAATSHDVDVTVTDAAGNSYMETLTIEVDNELDASQTVPAAQTINEDTTLTFTNGTATEVSVSDSVSATDSRMRVTLSVNDGVLNLSQTTGLTFVEGADGSGSLIIDGTESDINTALDGMTFTPDADFNGGVTLNMTTALAANLEGHYTFESATVDGTQLDDVSAGTTQDGTITGATVTSDAERGDVLLLDGTSDYVDIASDFDRPADATLAAWVNFTSVDSFGGEVISIGNGLILRVDLNGDATALFFNGSTFDEIPSGINVGDGNWHHLAFTFDDTANSQTLYVDGLAVATGSFSDSIDYANTGFTTTRIGSHVSDLDDNFEFNGMLDEARIYTRALSADEIAALATSQTETSDSVAITVDAVNDAPIVNGPGFTLSFTEQGTLNIHGTGFAIADVDDNGGDLLATLTVGEGRTLIDVGDSGVSVFRGNSTDTVTLSGTKAELNALLSGSSSGTITYYNDQTAASDVPSVSTTITLTVNDQGNTGNDPGDTGDNASEEGFASQTINITAVNDGPVFLGTELVTNGDFASGDLTGWTTTGTVVFSDDGLRFGGGGNASPHTASQVITTVVGETYALEFDYRDDRNGQNQQLQVTVDGTANVLTTEQILSDVDGTTYVRYRYSFVADSTSSTIIFADTTDNAGSVSNSGAITDGRLDNISVRQANGDLNSVNFTEDSTPVVLNGNLEIFDAELTDGDNFAGATITLTRSGGANSFDSFTAEAAGTLSPLTESGNLTVDGTTIGTVTTNSGGTLLLTLNGNATNALVKEAVQQIAYSNSNQTPNSSVDIDWSIDDGNSGSQGTGTATSSATTTVNITETADAPVITNLAGDTLNYNEGDGAVVIDQSADSVVTDVDSSDFDTGTLTVSFEAGSDNAEDVLAIVNQGTGSGQVGISGSNVTYEGTTIGTFTGGSSGADLLITLNANADAAAASALAQAITYENTDADNPSVGDRTVRYVLTDGDGGTSANYDTTISVARVNDVPTIINLDGETLNYSEGDGQQAIEQSGDALVADVDSLNFDAGTLTVSFTSGSDSAEDALSILNVGTGSGQIGISGSNVSYEGTTIGTFTGGASGSSLVITLNANADAAGTAALVEAISYENTDADNPTTGNRTVRFVLTDGDGGTSTNYDTTAAVTAVNDDPTNAGSLPSDVSVTEDVLTNVDLSSVDFSDVDAGGSDLTVTLSTSTGGELTLIADGSLIFGGIATARTITGTLADLNAYFDVTSNVRYVHGTQDTFGDDADTIQVVINDGGNTGTGGGTDQNLGTVNVDITAVNDEEILATNTGTTVAEGATGTTITTAMLETTDVDNTDVQLVYTVDVATTNGTLRLNGTALGVNDTFTQADIDAGLVTYDHDGSQTSADLLDFTVDDGAGTDTSATFNFTVTNVNDAPVITNVDGDTLSYDEGDFDVVIDQSGNATLTDADSVDFDGGNLTVSSSTAGDSTEDILSIRNQGTGAGQIGFIGINVTYENVLIGTASGGASGSDLIVTLNANADAEAVSALMQNVTYENSDNSNPTENARTVSFTVSDGDGGTSAASDVTINVNRINDAPVNSVQATETVAEDGTLTFSGAGGNALSVNDLDAGSSDIRVTITVTNGTFSLAGTTGLTSSSGDGTTTVTIEGPNSAIYAALDGSSYTPDTDFNGAATLTMESNDLGNTGSGGALTDTDVMNITVTAVNDTPDVYAPATDYTVDEQANLSIEGTGIVVADVDAASGTMTTTISVGEGALTIVEGDSGVLITSGNGGTSVVFTGTLAEINSLLDGSSTGTITYNNGSDTPSASTTLTVIINDEGNTGADPGATGDAFSESDTATRTINITALNDDPTNAGTLPSDVSVTEDVLTNVDLSAVDFSDVDASGSDLTVTLSTSTGGALTLAADGSLTFGGTTTARTITGSQADLNAYFNNASNIQYLHSTPHTFGDNSDTIQVVVNDNGNTGTGGGTDQTLGTVNVDITAVNDEEILATNTGRSVGEGSAGNVITTAMLETTDVDNTDAQLIYTVDVTTANGTLRLNGTALGVNDTFSQADIDAGLITYDHDGSQTLSDSFDFTVDDGFGTDTSATFNFSVTNVNDAPVNTVPGAQTVDEDNSVSIMGISVTDADDNLSTVQLTVNNGDLNVSLAGGATISAGANDSSDLTLSGTLAEINAALGTLAYQGDLNFNGSDTLIILSTDIDAATDSDTIAITVDAINDAPVVSAPGSAYSVDEQTNLSIEGTGFSVTDVDAATGTMTATFVVGEGTLTLDAGDSGVSITTNNASTVSFSGTLAQIDTLLAGTSTGTITFINNTNTPGASTIITLTVNDGGNSGVDPGLTADGSSEQDSANQVITFGAVNDDPFDSGSLPSDVSVTEDVLSNIDLSSVNFVDFDSSVSDLTVTLSTSTGGELTLAADGSLTFGGTSTARTITGSQADLNTYFNSASNIQYLHSTPHTFGNNADAIQVIVNDNGNTGNGGGTDQTLGTVNVDITAVNDEEVLATNTGRSVSEGSVGNAITTAMLETTDIDNTDSQLVYTADTVTSNGTLRLNGTALGLNDTFTQADIDAGNVTYDHDGSQTSADSFDFTVDDGSGTDTSATFNFTVTNVNDTPTNTVPGAQTADEDTSITISGISVADADDNLSTVQLTVNDGTLSVTFGGATLAAGANDSSDLTLSGSLADINAALATLTYQGDSNFNGSDTLTVLSTDSDSATDSDTVAITVDAVNDTPAVTAPGTALDADEQTDLDIHGTGFGVTDVDAASGTMTATLVVGEGDIALVAGDSGISITANNASTVSFTGTLAEIDALLTGTSSGTIVYNNGSDTPIASTNITLTVNDGGNTGSDPGLTADVSSEEDSATQTINITAENDAAVITNLDTDSFAYSEGDGAVVIDRSAAAIVSDVDSSDFDGGNLTVASSTPGDNSEDQLSVRDQGTGVSQIGFDGTNVTYQGTLIGTAIGGGNGSDLVIALNSNADAAAVSALTQNVTYENSDNDNPTEDNRTISFTLNDGDGAVSASSDVTISVSRVNDDPFDAGSLPSDIAVTEDVSSDVDLSTIDLGDVDADGGTLTVRLSTSTGGQLIGSTASGIVIGGAATARTITGTLADLNAYFDSSASIQYLHGTPHTNGDNADIITVTLNDNGNTGTGGSTDQNLGSVNIDITPVNDSPVAGTNAGATVSEGGQVTLTNAMLNEADVDDAGAGLLYTITSGPTNGQLELSSSPGAAISSFTQDDIDNNRIVFVHDGTDASADSFDFSLADGGEDSSTPATGTFNFIVTAVNDAPVLSSVEGAALNYTENAGAIPVTSSITISDTDDTHIESATVQITGNYNSSEDILSFSNQNGISGSYNSTNGTWTLTGTATRAEYEAALRSITYTNNSENPDTDPRTVTFQINDGTADSVSITRDILIAPTNDAPVVATNGGVTLSEGESGVVISSLRLETSDVDNNASELTYTIDSATNNGTLRRSGVAIGLNETFTQADVDAGLITYDHDDSETGSDSFDFTVDDGNGSGVTGSFTMTVNPVNDNAPVITSNGGLATASVDVVENGIAVTTVTATDGDLPSQSITYSIIGGADAGLFSVDGSGGQLTFNSAPDFEILGDANSDGIYEVVVRSSDGTFDDVQSISVRVTNANEQPTDISPDTFNVGENIDTTGGYVVGALAGTDPDVGDTHSFSVIGGPDAAVFSITGGNSDQLTIDDGVLDFETKPTYQVTIRVTDAGGLSYDENLTITVDDLNDRPVATDDTASVNEDSSVAGSVLGNDTDVDPLDTLSATLASTTSNGNLIFNPDGTYTYTPDANFFGTDEFTYQADDGTNLSNVATVSITVDPINDAPVTLDDNYTTNFNTALVVSGASGVASNDLDIDGDLLTTSLISGPSSGTLMLNSDGSFTFTPQSGFSGTVTFSYSASDGNANSNVATVTITVNTGTVIETDPDDSEDDSDPEDDSTDAEPDDTTDGGTELTETSDTEDSAEPLAPTSEPTSASTPVASQSVSQEPYGPVPEKVEDQTGSEAKSSETLLSKISDIDQKLVRNQLRLGSLNSQLSSYESFQYDLDTIEFALDEMQLERRQGDEYLHIISGSVSYVAIGATVGAAMWMMSSSALAALLTSALPAAASFDPIFILRHGRSGNSDEELSITELLEKQNQEENDERLSHEDQ